MINKDFWENKYVSGETGWDLGNVSPPLKAFIDALTDKNLRILIPGCGSAYEAKYLFSKGFKYVHILDIVSLPLQDFKMSNPDFPSEQLLECDFFEHEGQYDVILEQTFFCAVLPNLRENYVKKMCELLVPGGMLAGVLFNRSFEVSPPFGGSISEYRLLFEKCFQNVNIEVCRNSVNERRGMEVIFQAIR